MSVSKNKNGKYDVFIRYKNYKGETVQKRKTGFIRRKDAVEWENTFVNKTNNELTLEEAYNQYIEYASTRLRESTVRNKVWYAKNLKPMFHLFIYNITPSSILSWQKELKDLGKSNKTINCTTEILYTIFSHYNKMYNHDYNPVKAIDKLPTEKAKMKFWTLEEFEEFLSYIDSQEKRIAFKILFFSGIRYGELLGLTIGDIYDDYIDINKSYDYRSNKFCKTKNKQSVRRVQMPSIIMDEIHDYISKLYKPKKDVKLFNHPTNTWLSSQIRRTTKKHGLKHIRVHDLRHSHASMLINNGVDVLVVSQRLGHSNPTTTLNTYSHLYKEKSVIATKVLETLLSK